MAHLERYGHNAPAEPIEVTAIRVASVLNIAKPETSGLSYTVKSGKQEYDIKLE